MALMTKEGIVIENNKGNLKIMIQRNEACGACAKKATCGQVQKTSIDVFSNENFEVGDKVLIESDSSIITKYGIYVYIFPVVMIVLGAMIPSVFLKNTNLDLNLITLISIAIFALISFAVLKLVDRKVSKKNILRVRRK